MPWTWNFFGSMRSAIVISWATASTPSPTLSGVPKYQRRMQRARETSPSAAAINEAISTPAEMRCPC